MSQEYRPSSFRILPPVVKNLLIINGIFYVANLLCKFKFGISLEDILGLHYFFSSDFRPYQFVTYMFMHSSDTFSHIFFNMFALWMFGNALENYWGGKKFLIFYVVCGLGAALTHYVIFYFQIHSVMEPVSTYLSHPELKNFEGVFQPLLTENIHRPSEALDTLINSYNAIPLSNESEKLQASIDLMTRFRIDFLNEPVIIGASGAIFGVLLAFGMTFPNSMIYMYFLFPIKAKWFVMIYGAIELYSGIQSNAGDNVAHYAHLGGMLFGFVLIKIWQKSRNSF